MFGVGAAAGRVLTADDDRPDAAPVAVLSYQSWTRYFGQDPSIVSANVIINGQPFTIQRRRYVAVERAPSDTSTLRAAMQTDRVFVSKSADAEPATETSGSECVQSHDQACRPIWPR